MYDILIQQMRDEVTRVGARELRTPDEVDAVLPNANGTMLVVINSVCGCAAGVARPALAQALKHSAVPDAIVTVFAGQDKDATARAREYFTNQPPSSPSFALFRDGKFVHMVHRYQIEGHTQDQVAKTLTDAFDEYCLPRSEKSVA
jgi:putative YphP/YqiW family bacilliredoxin